MLNNYHVTSQWWIYNSWEKKNYDLDITYIIYKLKFVITLNIMLK